MSNLRRAELMGDVIGFSDTPKAIERNRTVSGAGKVVANLTR